MVKKKILKLLIILLSVSFLFGCSAKNVSAELPEKYVFPAKLNASYSEVCNNFSESEPSQNFEVQIKRAIMFATIENEDVYSERFVYAVLYKNTEYLKQKGDTLCVFNKDDKLSMWGFSVYPVDFSFDTFAQHKANLAEELNSEPFLEDARGNYSTLTAKDAYWFVADENGNKLCFCLSADYSNHSVTYMLFDPNISGTSEPEDAAPRNIVFTFLNIDTANSDISGGEA